MPFAPFFFMLCSPCPLSLVFLLSCSSRVFPLLSVVCCFFCPLLLSDCPHLLLFVLLSSSFCLCIRLVFLPLASCASFWSDRPSPPLLRPVRSLFRCPLSCLSYLSLSGWALLSSLALFIFFRLYSSSCLAPLLSRDSFYLALPIHVCLTF